PCFLGHLESMSWDRSVMHEVGLDRASSQSMIRKPGQRLSGQRAQLFLHIVRTASKGAAHQALRGAAFPAHSDWSADRPWLLAAEDFPFDHIAYPRADSLSVF